MIENYLNNLEKSADRFVKIASDLNNVDNIRIAALEDLTKAINICHQNKIKAKSILSKLDPARKFFSQSEFFNHCQSWPRGYQGDFIAVEHIMNLQKNSKTPITSPVYLFETYALNLDICTQHRNKLATQANLILDMINKKSDANILIVACGSAADVNLILPHLTSKNFHLVLNDSDKDALDFSKNRLSPIKEQCTFIHSNVFDAEPEFLKYGPYDLIIIGGLFDYLLDAHISVLLKNIFESYLRTGGQLFFTNIAMGNPFASMMKYLFNWVLIERDEKNIKDLVKKLNLQHEYNLAIETDQTGLTLLINISLLHNYPRY